MKQQAKLTYYITLTLLGIFLSFTQGFAHHTGEHAVTLNTNDKWDECAIVLDHSLTQCDFKAYVAEA